MPQSTYPTNASKALRSTAKSANVTFSTPSGWATYLNPYIYHRNGDLVGKICAQTGKGVREVVLERGLLSEEELNRILSPENLMNPHL